MRSMFLPVSMLGALLGLFVFIDAQAEPVTPDNYVVAETDWNFAAQQEKAPVNTWTHNERVTEENQTIIRSNADVV